MVIQNLTKAQNIAAIVGGQQTQQQAQGGYQAGYRGQGGAPARKDLEGYEGIGTYGCNFLDDGEGGMLVEFNSAVAKNGRFGGGAYPIRQVPELFGLAKEGFEMVITAIINQIIEDHGQEQEDGSVTLNFQPVDKNVNINYQDRLNYCVAVAPNQFITVAGLFEPGEAGSVNPGAMSLSDMVNAQQQRPRDPYMIKLARKSRTSNVIQRLDTGLTMARRDGAQIPVVILVDKLEAAPRAHIKGVKLAKMGQRGAAQAADGAGDTN